MGTKPTYSRMFALKKSMTIRFLCPLSDGTSSIYLVNFRVTKHSFHNNILEAFPSEEQKSLWKRDLPEGFPIQRGGQIIRLTHFDNNFLTDRSCSQLTTFIERQGSLIIMALQRGCRSIKCLPHHLGCQKHFQQQFHFISYPSSKDL